MFLFEKASLRDSHIRKPNAATSEISSTVSWLIDGLAAFQLFISTETYGGWIESLMLFITSPEVAECSLDGTVNITNRELNIKSKTQRSRREMLMKIIIQGFEQYIPGGMKRSELLRIANNNEELINIIVKFMQSD